LKINFAPAAAHAFAIAQAMLRLFATPKTRPTFPARTCFAITPSPYPPFASGKTAAMRASGFHRGGYDSARMPISD
jgi:hypothetical protein